MNNEINYKNNPLNGVGLKQLLNEIVEHYGYEILYAYLNINCFRANPSIDSSVKFLKKTKWAREKVEVFYLYTFKSLPRVSSEQFSLSPRDRIVPDDHKPGKPAELSLEDAERLREKRARKSAARGEGGGRRSGTGKSYGSEGDAYSTYGNQQDEPDSWDSPSASVETDTNPWANCKRKSKA